MTVLSTSSKYASIDGVRFLISTSHF